MKFSVTIDVRRIENDPLAELACILRQLANDVQHMDVGMFDREWSRHLNDSNGSTVGRMQFSREA